MGNSDTKPEGRGPGHGGGAERNIVTGLFIAFVAAGVFGFVTPLNRFTYDFGVNPATAAFFRLGFGAGAALLLVLVLRHRIAITAAGVPALLMVTISLSATTLLYLNSVAFIPVSLAVLIFYTYPLQVAAYTTVVERRPLGALRGTAFVIAFVGLAIAFGPSFEILDGLGILLAALAAVGLATMFVSTGHALKHVDVMTVMVSANVGSLPIMVAGVLLLGGIALPVGNAGWTALVASGVCYATGIFMNFAAIKFAGPTRTAMMFNLEPIVAIVVSAVVLGEALGTIQYAGGALVIGALVMTSLADRRPTGDP